MLGEIRCSDSLDLQSSAPELDRGQNKSMCARDVLQHKPECNFTALARSATWCQEIRTWVCPAFPAKAGPRRVTTATTTRCNLPEPDSMISKFSTRVGWMSTELGGALQDIA